MHKHAAKHCTNEYDKLAKTKNLDGKMGIVGDDRFATGCDKFEGTTPVPTPVHRDTKTMCSMTKWDPTDAECANFVKEHGCAVTYGSICTEGTAVPHAATLEKGCPVACASFTKEKEEKKEKTEKEVAKKAQAKADAAAA